LRRSSARHAASFFLALLHHLDALNVRRALSFTLLPHASGFFLFTLAFFEGEKKDDGS
jgi:hypothetical protein